MLWDPRQGRFAPAAGPEHYKSYTMTKPLSTHWRKATCEEAECEAYRLGFVTTVDVATDIGKKQYYYLTHSSKRSYSMQRVSLSVVKFLFRPGSICMQYQDHRVPVERLPFYLVSGGDWRGNPRGTPRFIHRTPQDWVEDFALHQEKISEVLKRG